MKWKLVCVFFVPCDLIPSRCEYDSCWECTHTHTQLSFAYIRFDNDLNEKAEKIQQINKELYSLIRRSSYGKEHTHTHRLTHPNPKSWALLFERESRSVPDEYGLWIVVVCRIWYECVRHCQCLLWCRYCWCCLMPQSVLCTFHLIFFSSRSHFSSPLIVWVSFHYYYYCDIRCMCKRDVASGWKRGMKRAERGRKWRKRMAFFFSFFFSSLLHNIILELLALNSEQSSFVWILYPLRTTDTHTHME